MFAFEIFRPLLGSIRANTEKSRIGVDVKYLGTIDLDSLPEKSTRLKRTYRKHVKWAWLCH